METREELIRRGSSAYERGRMMAATRVLLVVAPLAAACALVNGAFESCACLGVLAAIGAVALRWRDRAGARAAFAALAAGIGPLFVGLVLAALVPGCRDAPVWSWCSAVCFTLGIAAGSRLGLRLANDRATAVTWTTATAIAVSISFLGCAPLGVGGMLGVSVSLVVGSAWATFRRAVSP